MYLMKKAKTVGDPGLVTRPSTVMSSTKLMDFAHKVQQLDGEIRDNPVHSSGKGLSGRTFSPRYGSLFWFNPLLPRIQLISLSLNCLYLFSPGYSSFRMVSNYSHPDTLIQLVQVILMGCSIGHIWEHELCRLGRWAVREKFNFPNSI